MKQVFKSKSLPGLSKKELNKITVASLNRGDALRENQKLANHKQNGKKSGNANIEEKRGIFSENFDIIENAKKQFKTAAKKKMVLTEKQANSIRTEFDSGTSRKELQEKYGVSKSTIQRIVVGTRY